jgi:quercetin dioxygenase-like cupin family protein
MRRQLREPPPAACCSLIWAVLGFVGGVLYCRVSEPNESFHPRDEVLVHWPSEAIPINHPDSVSGVASSVLKRVHLQSNVVPHLVHLSTVNFGTSGSFPIHSHGDLFNEVFLVTSGCGEFTVNGEKTNHLTEGAVINLTPGTTHSGRAVPCDETDNDNADEPFTMAYFAILE